MMLLVLQHFIRLVDGHRDITNCMFGGVVMLMSVVSTYICICLVLEVSTVESCIVCSIGTNLHLILTHTIMA